MKSAANTRSSKETASKRKTQKGVGAPKRKKPTTGTTTSMRSKRTSPTETAKTKIERKPNKKNAGRGGKGKSPRHAKPGRSPQQKALFLAKWAAIGGLLLAALGAATLTVMFWVYGADENLPQIEGLHDYHPAQVNRVLTSDGEVIGEIFEQKGIHIHSMDSCALGWLHLLENEGHLDGTGCEILIIDDEVDFALIFLSEGLPVSFRSLHAKISDEGIGDELAHEIGYTLTTLDAEYDLPAPSTIAIWSLYELPRNVRNDLKEKSGLTIQCNDLATLPPLSRGIIARALRTDNRIELIPQEWIEHKKNKRLQKKFSVISAAIVAVWLVFVLVFAGVYKTRTIKLNRIQKRADAIAPAAATAFENREKLKALKIYTDRSSSALECLREVTSLLPPGDIEFASFNYNQGKGVTIRGSAETDDAVYDFFNSLTDSPLFEQLKDQSVNTRNTRGTQRSVFSATLMLPSGENDQ